MAQDKPYKTAAEPDRKPMYMGKTLVALSYGASAALGLASVGMAWVVINTYQTGGPLQLTLGMSAELFMLGLLLAVLLVLTVAAFISPTLWDQFPNLRHQNQYSSQRLNAQWNRSLNWKWRREAVRRAPAGVRRGIRICRWAIPMFAIAFVAFTIVSKYGWMPAPLIGFQSHILGIIGHYGMMILIAVIAPISIVQDLLTRRAIRLYERELKRAETDAEHCPECDYPIDPDRPEPVCPECGLVRSVPASAPQE